MEAPVQTDELSAARISKACHLDERVLGLEPGEASFRTFSDLFTDETDVNLAPALFSPCQRERKGY